MVSIFTFVSLLLNLLVVVPLSSAVVRWRAHYSPSRVRYQNRYGERQTLVENEGAIAPVLGYFAVLKRVYKVEGLMGYYKGLVPRVLGILLAMAIFSPRTVFSLKALGGSGNDMEGGSQKEDNVFLDTTIIITKRLSHWVVRSALQMSLEIIVNRAIATSYKLPWLSPAKSLRILLSPTERRSPWKLYLLPGYLLSRAIKFAFWLGVGPIRDALMPDGVRNPPPGQRSIGTKKVIPYILFHILLMLVQTPLQVAIVRLSLQRYQDAEVETRPGGNDNFGIGRILEEQVPGIQRYSNEDVIVLKDTYRYPYTGLLDCLNTIINEEGWKTLMKSGWLTFLGM
ncbi:hypothetical protein PM082_000344 [Marasmius tenuissimus]|nr:hypothetical protein PM082_000344 [Marasmius tenuissimus]